MANNVLETMENRISYVFSRIGDMVQIHDDSQRVNCKIGVVTDIVRGNDGLIRSAHVRTRTGETIRPIVKLYPLKVTNSEMNIPRGDENSETTNTDNRPMRHAKVKALGNIKQWIGKI